MKLRDYKTLLATDKRTAMLFDLTERFPRGPSGKLRDRDYKDAEGNLFSEGWGSSEVPYLREGQKSAEGSTQTAGWNPYDIYELDHDDWRCASVLQSLEVPKDMAMGDDWRCDEGRAKLFKVGGQITRRAKRMARRVREAKKWVENNIGTAVYKINFGWRARDGIFVHADNKEGAKKQFELFMAGAFNEHCEGWQGADEVRIEYLRPAKTPLELMALNAPIQAMYREAVEKKRARIIKLQKEIEAMDTAEQIVNIYAINMVATWGTGEGEDINV
jgi:hypothetical protein